MQGRTLPAAKKLIEEGRKAGCEIIYTVIELLTKDGREPARPQAFRHPRLRGSEEAKMIPDVTPAEDDIVLPKTSSGVFNSTIDYVLRNLGVENVVVAGTPHRPVCRHGRARRRRPRPLHGLRYRTLVPPTPPSATRRR